MLYTFQLRKLRENRSLTQLDIANILKISRGAYSEYEIEYNIMPINHLNTLVNYFNVSLDYIFGFTNKLNYEKNKEKIDLALSGKRLKELRKELKLNQTKFAEKLSTSFTTISGYERGIYTIATPFLYQICSKYKISADYLLGKVDSPKYLN